MQAAAADVVRSRCVGRVSCSVQRKDLCGEWDWCKGPAVPPNGSCWDAKSLERTNELLFMYVQARCSKGSGTGTGIEYRGAPVYALALRDASDHSKRRRLLLVNKLNEVVQVAASLGGGRGPASMNSAVLHTVDEASIGATASSSHGIRTHVVDASAAQLSFELQRFAVVVVDFQ